MGKGEHRAACFEVALNREQRGEKRWAETLDVSAFFNNDEPFEANRAGIVAVLKASKWYGRRSKLISENVDFLDAVDGIAQAEDADEFDQHWETLYDIADLEDRVWIETF